MEGGITCWDKYLKDEVWWITPPTDEKERKYSAHSLINLLGLEHFEYDTIPPTLLHIFSLTVLPFPFGHSGSQIIIFNRKRRWQISRSECF